MNLRELEYLVALADHRHFGEAAAACYVSQPTLSTQVRKLEAELGVQLVERAPRRVTLTAAGEAVVDRARGVLRGVADIRAVARAGTDPASGTLRVGLFPTLAPYLLPHVVGGVRARFPRLELLLVEEKTQVLLDQLRAGRLDLAVLARPVGEDGLDEQALFGEEFVLAAPAGHPLADGDGPVPLAALAGQPVLLLDEGHCLRDHALSVCHLVGASERTGFRATSLETLRQMVAAGVGVTLLPRLAVAPPVPASPGIHLRRFADPVPRREIAAVWRRTSPHRDFLPQVAAALAGVPAGLVEPPAA